MSTLQKLQSDHGMRCYASYRLGLLRGSEDDYVPATDPDVVSRCVNDVFDGDVSEFQKSAEFYLHEGRGVVG